MKTCINCNKEIIRESRKFFSSDYQWNKVRYCSYHCRKTYWKEKGCSVTAYMKLRFEVFKRDNFKCVYCGRSPVEEENVRLELEHIEPINKKATKEMWENIGEEDMVTACKECNIGKGNNRLSVEQLKRIKERNMRLIVEK